MTLSYSQLKGFPLELIKKKDMSLKKDEMGD